VLTALFTSLISFQAEEGLGFSVFFNGQCQDPWPEPTQKLILGTMQVKINKNKIFVKHNSNSNT
jgi:hypothetical protein